MSYRKSLHVTDVGGGGRKIEKKKRTRKRKILQDEEESKYKRKQSSKTRAKTELAESNRPCMHAYIRHKKAVKSRDNIENDELTPDLQKI